jgi:hypothetical protein
MADIQTPRGGVVNIRVRGRSGFAAAVTRATDINDAGRIAGYGSIGGQTHAFLLTPVPEPGALGLAGVAAVAGLLRRRRR